MANNAWDRQIINVRERPLSSDINAAQSQLDRSVRDMLAALFTSKLSGSDLSNNPQSGFLGDGFKVRPPVVPSLSVQVTKGLGFAYQPGDVPSAVGGVTGLDDLSVYKPLPLLATANINAIPAGPAAGQDRYDIIEVRTNRVLGNPSSRDTLDTLSGVFTAGLVNKTLAFTLDGSVGIVTSPAASTAAVSYKVGIAAGVGAAVVPSATSGYVVIATIFSSNGNMTGGITRANIIDQRLILQPYGMMPFSASFSVPSGAAAPPTGVTLRASPGVECVVVKTAAPANNQFDVYIIGGAFGVGGGNMQGEILRNTYSGVEFLQLVGNGTVFGLLTAPLVGFLQNASIAGPASVFAVGQPYMRTTFYSLRQSGGTTDAAIPDPGLFDIQGFLQRY